MSDDKIELNRRRVLGGLATIGVASAGAGAGTMAYFSDNESVDNNSVSAGTLDLTTGTKSSFKLDLGDKAPGDSGTTTLDITNSGSLSGSNAVLDANINDITGTGGSGSSEYEDDTANLGDNLEVRIWIDVDDNDSFDSGDYMLKSDETIVADGSGYSGGYDTLNNYSGTTWNGIRNMGSGNTDEVNVDWQIPDAGTGNNIQGDSVEFDLTFQLRQSGGSGL